MQSEFKRTCDPAAIPVILHSNLQRSSFSDYLGSGFKIRGSPNVFHLLVFNLTFLQVDSSLIVSILASCL